MSNPVRRLHTFYEPTGPFAVSRSRAERIVLRSLGAVSQHAGFIALEDTKPMALSVPDAMVNASDITFDNAPHALFLTGRGFAHPRAEEGKAAGDGHFIDESGTRAFVHVGESTEEQTLVASARAIKEIAHTFGVVDCPDPNCITGAPTATRALEEFGEVADPFCNDCADDLKFAGLQALATEL